MAGAVGVSQHVVEEAVFGGKVGNRAGVIGSNVGDEVALGVDDGDFRPGDGDGFGV